MNKILRSPYHLPIADIIAGKAPCPKRLGPAMLCVLRCIQNAPGCTVAQCRPLRGSANTLTATYDDTDPRNTEVAVYNPITCPGGTRYLYSYLYRAGIQIDHLGVVKRLIAGGWVHAWQARSKKQNRLTTYLIVTKKGTLV